MIGEICRERQHQDSKHEWMPYRWEKDQNQDVRAKNTVMRLSEVICKYCLEKKTV